MQNFNYQVSVPEGADSKAIRTALETALTGYLEDQFPEASEEEIRLSGIDLVTDLHDLLCYLCESRESEFGSDTCSECGD